MTTYTITGSANLADDVAPFLGQWEIRFPSTTTTADDGDGSWRGGVKYLDVDRTTGECNTVLPGTVGDQAYSATFTPKDKQLKAIGPFVFTLTEDTTWADIITTPQTPPIPWTAEDAFVAGLFSTNSATRLAVDNRYDGRYLKQTTGTHSVYVSPTGFDSNDGQSSGTAFKTLQKAFDYLAALGPVLQGKWYVELAAGTYPAATVSDINVRSVAFITVRGPSVSGGVPTAILDGTGGGDYSHGITVSGTGVQVELRDIKFINFNGDPSGNSRCGAVGQQASNVFFNNCHATGATWTGLYMFQCVRGYISGGIVDGCRIGAAANASPATIDGLLTKNSTESGIEWGRGSQGHVDNCTFEANITGLLIDANARVDTINANFKRNTTGLWLYTGGIFTEGGTPNNFNNGGADANTTNIKYSAFSGDHAELRQGTSEVRVAFDRTARGPVTGTTSATNLVPTVYTIPANRLQGIGKGCRVVVYGIYTMTAASTLTVKIGTNTLTITIPAAASGLPFKIEAELLEVNGGYRCFGLLTQGLNQSRFAQASGFTNNAAAAISVDVTPANVADTVTVYRTDVYLIG